MTTPRAPATDVGILEGQPESRLSPSFYDFFVDLEQSSVRAGQATFAAGTSIVVPLSPQEISANYLIYVEATENNTFWVTGKQQDQFTINAATSTSATVGWTLVRI